ncbi:FecR domain-containing protein [Chitinophaga sp. 212800008-4]|uniref:FecR family protein n=1 Tax=unclassified Chitinophaga TaxID=2619133 RepID=UPI0030CA8907
MMHKDEFEQLLRKYRDEQLNEDELALLYEYIHQGAFPEVVDHWLEETFHDPAYAGSARDYAPADIFAAMESRMGPEKKVFPWWKAAVAAAAVLLSGICVYWFSRPAHAPTPIPVAIHFDAPPGKSGAMLTLGSGQQILLDSAGNGRLARQGATNLQKEEGQLSYQRQRGSSGDSLVYNTVSTPRGRQFRLVLADGTHVWLNAGSQIRFPAAFTGKERRVDISGEAYFEVKPDPEMPFIIQAHSAQIRVLGTSFNVADYDDEKNMTTTLLEGSVKIHTTSTAMLLQPGQQASIEKNTGKLSAKTVDTEQAVAWTKDRLALNNTDFAELMRRISRWYDVDVVYAGKVPDIHIGGSLHRNVNLSVVLEFLGENGVHYTTNGKTVTILP